MKKLISLLVISCLLTSFSKHIMQGLMFRFSFHKKQVLNSIIISNVVHMMNNFFRIKKSANACFHYKSVFFNIIVAIFKRMIRRINNNISSMLHSSFKLLMIFSAFKRSFIWLHQSNCSFIERFLSFLKLSSIREVLSDLPLAITIFRTKRFFSSMASFYIERFRTMTTFNIFTRFSHAILLVLFLAVYCVFPNKSMAAIQWRNGQGELTIDGTTYASLIGYNSYNKIVQPLDNLLSTYCTEYLVYNSSTTITVKAGSCVVSNSQGSIRMFMLDTGDTNLTTANLDAGGSFSAGTTYYVYATSPNATTQTSTYYISLSSTAPTGQSYYYQIGSFVTDSNSYITTLSSKNRKSIGAYQSKTVGATYLATTDGFLVGIISTGASGNSVGNIFGYSDSASSPSTLCGQANMVSDGANRNDYSSFMCPVKAGDYYKVTFSYVGGSTPTTSMYFTPLN